MTPTVSKYIFLLGLVVQEAVRFPHRRRHRQEWRDGKMAETRTSRLDFSLDMLAFTGMDIVPILFIFTPIFNFADYSPPPWFGWVGLALLIGATWLLRRAHADLGRNWTPTLHIAQGHALITQGVYAHIRHPIYAAIWLTGLAQLFLLANWIAGPACLVLFLPVYFVRIPREERMMLDHFGDAYRGYVARSGRVIPRRTRTANS
jgi:protein-S-isoprenylcysteine O-methyltransferase Ste14